MHQIVCQVLINHPKRLLIIGVLFLVLGLGWFSGGPIRMVWAQTGSAPCLQAGSAGPAFDIKQTADQTLKEIGQVNEKALNIRLKCDYDPADPKKGVVGVWRVLLGAADILVALYLIAIAVATIFHIQYDTYSIKKTLPPLIVGVILANFSLFIVRFLVDFATVLTATFINSEGGLRPFIEALVKGLYSGGAQAVGGAVTALEQGQSVLAWIGKIIYWFGAGGGTLLWVILGLLGIIFILIPGIIVLVLALLFYARYYVILLLAVVSPLAFVAMAFPATQPLFRRWWSELIRWTFMLPVSFFLLWLAIRFGGLMGSEANFATYFITLVFMYLAIRVPFSWGTLMGVGVTAGVYGLAKKAGTAAAGYGFGKLAYKIGDLRARAGAKTQAARDSKARAETIKKQLRGRMPETYKIAEEYSTGRRQLLSQLKGAKTTDAKELIRGQLKELKAKYQPKMRAMRTAERESLFEGGLLKAGKDELLERAKRVESRAVEEERRAAIPGVVPGMAELSRRSAAGLRRRAEQYRRAAEEKTLVKEKREVRQQAKGYESSASQITGVSHALSYLHLPGMVEAVKTRYKLAGEFGAKELKKTSMYQRLAGPHFAQDAGYAAYESTRHFTPEQAAQFLDSQLLSKINRNIYNTPEKLARLLRDLVAESPARMLRYLQDNTEPGKKVGDFDFGGIQRSAEISLRYLSGQPALRDEFSRSLQRVPSIGGDAEVLSEYIKAGGAGGILPLRVGPQGWQTIAETVGRVVAQQMGKVSDQALTDQIMNLEVGRVNVREAINAGVLNTANQRIFQPAKNNLRGVVSMQVDVGTPRIDSVISTRLGEIESAINGVIRDRGSDIRDVTEITGFESGGKFHDYVGRDGLPALRDYLTAAVARQKMAEVFVLKQNPILASNRAEIIRTANNYVNSLQRRRG